MTTNQQFTNEVLEVYAAVQDQTELERMQELNNELKMIEDYLSYKGAKEYGQN